MIFRGYFGPQVEFPGRNTVFCVVWDYSYSKPVGKKYKLNTLLKSYKKIKSKLVLISGLA